MILPFLLSDTLTQSLWQHDQQFSGTVAGVDEVGRGPLAGHVVASCVILNPKDIIQGIRDSKKVSAVKRNSLAISIKERSIAWSVASVSPQKLMKVIFYKLHY